MFFYGDAAQSKRKWSNPVVFLFRSVSLLAIIMSPGVGCMGSVFDSSQHTETKSLAFGVIDVQSDGANPRGYPTKVRFFLLTNLETHETFRIDVDSDSQVFSWRLSPGNYSVDRIQFHEGPFMAESHVRFEFSILPEKAVWLGVWTFQVQTPRTIRLVRAKFLEGKPELPRKILAQLVSESTSLGTVLPNPDSFETRVFSVAPIPKVRYFNR